MVDVVQIFGYETMLCGFDSLLLSDEVNDLRMISAFSIYVKAVLSSRYSSMSHFLATLVLTKIVFFHLGFFTAHTVSLVMKPLFVGVKR